MGGDEAEALASAGLLPDEQPDAETVRLVALWERLGERDRKLLLALLDAMAR